MRFRRRGWERYCANRTLALGGEMISISRNASSKVKLRPPSIAEFCCRCTLFEKNLFTTESPSIDIRGNDEARGDNSSRPTLRRDQHTSIFPLPFPLAENSSRSIIATDAESLLRMRNKMLLCLHSRLLQVSTES